MKNDPKHFWKNHWKNDVARINVIDKLTQKINSWPWNKNLSIEDSVVLPMVHATDASIAWSIAAAGFAALAILDPGFYGKGIYFSSSAMYTLPYVASKTHPAILICFTAPGNPYPVIENPSEKNNLLGKNILHGYQSHYVITSKSCLPWRIEDGPENCFDELVLSLEAQVIPLFLLRIDKSNLTKLVADFVKPRREENQ